MSDYEELVQRLRESADWADHFAVLMGRDSDVSSEIKREAADAIEELQSYADLYKELTEKGQTVARKLIDAYPKWISVEERLPKFDQKVLVWVKNKDPEGRFNQDGIYTAELKDKVPKPDPEGKNNFWGIPGYDSAWTVWAWSYFTEPDVLYWMPLPEPPKEVSTT